MGATLYGSRRAADPPNDRRGRRRGRPATYGTRAYVYDTVVVVPARNEEVGILTSLNSLARQSERPDLIIVVVNNSTDNTEAYAASFAAQWQSPKTIVLVLRDNPHKKAGALNFGIEWLRRQVGGRLDTTVKHLLTMDADTELHPKFIERATNVMESDQNIGGVSAACFGRTGLWRNPWQRYLLGMQILEYGRAANMRYRSDIHTMAGAGSFYRGKALQSLLDLRGMVFWEDHRNLVEDYETTLTLKECGWKVTANQLCIAYTDLMPTMKELLQQRERWVRGTVDALRRRGWSKSTWHSIATMILGLFGAAYVLGWGTTQLAALAVYGVPSQPVFWVLATFWIIYPAIRVRNLGWKAMVVEALLIPQLVYTVVRTYWIVSSIFKSYTTRVSSWK